MKKSRLLQIEILMVSLLSGWFLASCGGTQTVVKDGIYDDTVVAYHSAKDTGEHTADTGEKKAEKKDNYFSRELQKYGDLDQDDVIFTDPGEYSYSGEEAEDWGEETNGEEVHIYHHYYRPYHTYWGYQWGYYRPYYSYYWGYRPYYYGYSWYWGYNPYYYDMYYDPFYSGYYYGYGYYNPYYWGGYGYPYYSYNWYNPNRVHPHPYGPRDGYFGTSRRTGSTQTPTFGTRRTKDIPVPYRRGNRIDGSNAKPYSNKPTLQKPRHTKPENPERTKPRTQKPDNKPVRHRNTNRNTTRPVQRSGTYHRQYSSPSHTSTSRSSSSGSRSSSGNSSRSNSGGRRR